MFYAFDPASKNLEKMFKSADKALQDSMVNQQARCYSCLEIFPYRKENLHLECRCYNSDDKDKVFYRGVCLGCKNVPRSDWKTKKGDWHKHHLKAFVVDEGLPDVSSYKMG